MADGDQGQAYDIYHADANVTSKDWRWDSRRNRWQGWLLWYCSAGKGRIEYPGRSGAAYEIEPGACFLFRMHEWHLGEASTPLSIHAIAFTTAEGADKPLWKGQRRFRQLRRADFVQSLIDRSIEAYQQNSQDGSDHGSQAAQAWLTSALRAVAEEDAMPQLSGKAAAQDEAVRKLQQEIRANLHKSWSSAEVMQALGLGREQALRVFKRCTGTSPGAWVNRCRLDRAAYLLRFSERAIKNVANEVGYDDPYFFSRQFKKYHGLSPRAYRQQGWTEDIGNH